MHRWRRTAALLGAVVAAVALAGVAAAQIGGSGDGASAAGDTEAAGASRAGTAALARRLRQALTVPHASLRRSGALAVDLASGRVVFSLNADRPFVPASNEKLPVGYAALVRLGPSYRFRTTVLGAGDQRGATWSGDLYLRGGGDPTLQLAGLRRLAAQLRSAGIRRVSGGVLADESFFDSRRTAPGWRPSFYLNESPPLSALVLDRAVFRGRTTRDPAGAAAAVFVRVLGERGIRVRGESGWGTAPQTAFPLAQVESAPLARILRLIDGDSDNFTAELVLKALGAEVLGRGTTAAGARVVVDTLAEAGMPLAGVRIVDGSGLSRLDRLTPRLLAAILLAAWDDEELRPVLWGSLAVAGRSGTLERRLRRRPAFGAVRAKTGTTALASALSGFVRHRFAFVVVQNGHPVATASARRAQDRFAAALAAAPAAAAS